MTFSLTVSWFWNTVFSVMLHFKPCQVLIIFSINFSPIFFYIMKRYWQYTEQSSKSGWAFRVGFRSGSGLKLTKILCLIRVWDVLFVLGAQKYNQNNLATLLDFLDLT